MFYIAVLLIILLRFSSVIPPFRRWTGLIAPIIKISSPAHYGVKNQAATLRCFWPEVIRNQFPIER